MTGVLDWPYVEGLRLDEAMHPLTILATGLYGETLPPQDGAPVRLVVPWKYGFKSIKSIVKISLVDQRAADDLEYSGAKRIRVLFERQSECAASALEPGHGKIASGNSGRAQTLMFNGYADQVAHLYKGMDLARRSFLR